MTQEKTQIMDNCVAVVLEVRLCSGRKKLRTSDLGEGIHLPPNTLASLGSKRVCDPDSLKIFTTKKMAAERLLRNVGPKKVLGNNVFVVPVNRIDEVYEGLDTIEAEFNAARNEFRRNYNTNMESWLSENEEWRGIIENSLLSVDEMVNRISFSYHGFAFSEATHPSLKNSLNKKLIGLTGRLFREVSQVCKEVFERSFQDRDKVYWRSLGPLRIVRDKLAGFAPFQSKVRPIVEDLDRVLNAIPNNGLPIDGMELFGLQGILLLLKDPQEAVQYAEKRLEGGSGEVLFEEWKMFNGLIPTQANNEQNDTSAIEPQAELPVSEELQVEEPVAEETPTNEEMVTDKNQNNEVPVFEEEEEEEEEPVYEEIEEDSDAPAPLSFEEEDMRDDIEVAHASLIDSALDTDFDELDEPFESIPEIPEGYQPFSLENAQW